MYKQIETTSLQQSEHKKGWHILLQHFLVAVTCSNQKCGICTLSWWESYPQIILEVHKYHLYSPMEKASVSAKCLAKDCNTRTRPGIKPRSLIQSPVAQTQTY